LLEKEGLLEREGDLNEKGVYSVIHKTLDGLFERGGYKEGIRYYGKH
jgi:hypothetical protein